MSGRRSRELVGVALVLVAALAALYKIQKLGFYDDDWAWLSMMGGSRDQTWWGVVKHFVRAQSGVWVRPANFVAFPFLFRVFGEWALGWHLTLFALNAWCGVAFWRWLEEEGAGRATAGLAAGLFLLWPNHDATRHWVALFSSPAALALTFEALRARKLYPVASGLLILVAGLFYEAAAPLALAPLLLEAWRHRRQGLRRAATEGLRASVALLLGLFFLVLWQRVLTPWLLHPERHPMSLSPVHAWKVYQAGLECQLFNRLWHLLFKHAQWAWLRFGWKAWVAWALGAAVLARWSRESLAEEPPATEPLVFGVILLVLGYAPYVLDATYTPVVFSATNRVNFVPSAGAALVAAWALRRAYAGRRLWARRAALALSAALPAAFLLSSWASNAQWAEAARRQNAIVNDLVPRLAALPDGPKTVLLFGLDTFIGSAPVFNSTYDLDGALYLARGDADVKGLVAEGRMRFDDASGVMSWFGETRVPYAGLYAYRADTGAFARLADKAAADAFVPR